MGQCYGRDHERQSQKAHQQVRQVPIAPVTPKITRVEQIDFIKGKLKNTRDKIDNLISQHERQLSSINRQIDAEKQLGLKNKPKAIYLLKQRKQFQQQIANLITRKQVIVKTLNTLSQQHLDREMVTVLQQSNQYMRKVEEELERKNWREILAEAKNNRYNPVEFAQAEEDPDVNLLYAQLEREVMGVGSGTQVHVQGVGSVRNSQYASENRRGQNVQYN